MPLTFFCIVLFIGIGRNISKHFSNLLRTVLLERSDFIDLATQYATYSAIITSFVIGAFFLFGWLVGKRVIEYINSKKTLSRKKRIACAWGCAGIMLIVYFVMIGLTLPSKIYTKIDIKNTHRSQNKYTYQDTIDEYENNKAGDNKALKGKLIYLGPGLDETNDSPDAP